MTGKFKHVYAPTRGIITNSPPTLLKPEASPYMKGVVLKDGVVSSDYGHTAFPVVSDTTTNALNGSVMRLDQFYTLAGLGFLLALTTTGVYHYNTSTGTWDVITKGVEIDDCEAAWDAQADVTSTADTTIKLRNSKSAKHIIASGFTTGIVSSEDDLQNADISAATNTQLAFWVRSTAAHVAGVFRLRLSEQATGGTGATYADYNIPALVADTWQHCVIDISSPDASDGGTYPDDLNALASVALVAVSDPGVVTVYLDDIRTVQAFTGDVDNRFSTANMNDTFVFTNGIDQSQKITEAGGVLTVADLVTTLAAGTITTSEVALAFKDHLLLMANTENAADAPQRVSWTNIGATEDWIAGTAGYQDLVDDESWIVGAELLSENEVIIYKERSVVKMIWVGGHTPFRFQTMVAGTGAVSKEGITNIGGEHICFGPDVVFTYKGGYETEVIDDVVKKTMYSRLNGEYAGRLFLAFIEEDDELQIWMPTDTEYPDEVWCMNTVGENWYKKTRTMTGFGYYQQQSSFTIGDLIGNIGDQNWRFGDALTKAYYPITLVGDQNGYVYKLDKMTSDNAGVAITNEFQTPDFVLPDEPDYMNYFMRVPQLIFEALGDSVTTTWSSDGGNTWSPTQGAGTNTTTLDSNYKVYQQDFDCTVRKIRFKFYNNTVSSGFSLRYYGFYWIPRSGRR